jgi:hypothetical protein
VLTRIPRQPHCIYWHRFRGASWAQISGRNSVQYVRTCIEIEGCTVQKLWAQFSRTLSRVSRYFPAGYSIVFAEILARISRQSVQHLLLGQPYNGRIFGTKIEELHRTVQKESLQNKKAEISLCNFSENEYVVNEISLKLTNHKKPSLTGFHLVGFSRVIVRPKISVLFSEFMCC